MDIEVQFYNDDWVPDVNGLNFRGCHWVELYNGGGESKVIADMWLRCTAGWGTATFTGYFDAKWGTGISNTGKRTLGVPEEVDFHPVPSKTRRIWIEGRRQNFNTILNFGLLPLGR